MTQRGSRRLRMAGTIVGLVGLLAAVGGGGAADDVFKGKTIRIIVGFAAGGGFDAYARVIARHMGKHIPGHPTLIVENMPGAGSVIAGNHLYRVAKPDGLTVGHFIGTLFMNQLLGQKGIEFDARKFEFIGSPALDHVVCAFTKASGITSLEKWMAAPAPVKMGAVAPGSTTDNAPRTLKAALGLPLRLVSGYKGTSEIRLAAESGEVNGACWGWGSLRSTWRKALDTGEVVVVLQAGPRPHPDLPSVPNAISLAKTDEARRLIEIAIHTDSAMVRSFTLPPGTPKDRVQTLRKAFQATLRDPAFLAEADKTKLEVEPITGEAIEGHVDRLFKLEPAMVAKLRTVLLE